MEVGEIVIGTMRSDGDTLVRGSASRAVPLLTRFLSTLAPPLDLRQTEHRRGVHRVSGAEVKSVDASPMAPALPKVATAA